MLRIAAGEPARGTLNSGTFNIAGDGVVLLSQCARRLGSPTVPVLLPAVTWVGAALRTVGVTDFSREQIRLLTHGRVVSTVQMRETLGFPPRLDHRADLRRLRPRPRQRTPPAAGRRPRLSTGSPRPYGHPAPRTPNRAPTKEQSTMADAKVIPFDDDRPRRRRPRTPAPVRALPEAPQPAAGPEPGPARDDGGWERRIAGGLAFLRRRLTGEYEVDEFGYDEELTDQVLMSLLRPVYEKYFRVEVKGIENIPADGGALIVANHSGTLPLDGLMLQGRRPRPAPRRTPPAAARRRPRLPAAGRQRGRPQGRSHPGLRRGRRTAAGRGRDRRSDARRGSRGSASRSASGTSSSGSGGAASSRRPCARASPSCPAPSWAPRRSTRWSATPAPSRGCWGCRTSR